MSIFWVEREVVFFFFGFFFSCPPSLSSPPSFLSLALLSLPPSLLFLSETNYVALRRGAKSGRARVAFFPLSWCVRACLRWWSRGRNLQRVHAGRNHVRMFFFKIIFLFPLGLIRRSGGLIRPDAEAPHSSSLRLEGLWVFGFPRVCASPLRAASF